MSDLTGYCRHEPGRDEFTCDQCRELMERGSFPLYGFEPLPNGLPRWQHDLKILEEFLGAVVDGLKSFEVRRNDRDFRVGDVLNLKEWDNLHEAFTGVRVQRRVSYITDYEQKPGFVVLGLQNWLVIRARKV